MSQIIFLKDYLSCGTEGRQYCKQEDKLGVYYSNLSERWCWLRWIRMVAVEVVRRSWVLDVFCGYHQQDFSTDLMWVVREREVKGDFKILEGLSCPQL